MQAGSKQRIYYPLLALILGGLGAALRMWQRSSGYDGSGLPITGAPASLALIGFLVAVSALYVILALRMPKSLGDDPSPALSCGKAEAGMLMVCAALLIAAAGLAILSFATGYQEAANTAYSSGLHHSTGLKKFFLDSFLSLLLALAAVPTAVALLYRAKQAGQDVVSLSSFVVLMPPVYLWIWLIESYRQHTANPILWDYVLLLFAIITQLIGAYYRAGFAFGVGRPRPAVLFSLLGMTFSILALWDKIDGAATLSLLAFFLFTLAELLGLPAFRVPPVGAPSSSPEQPETQEEASHE